MRFFRKAHFAVASHCAKSLLIWSVTPKGKRRTRQTSEYYAWIVLGGLGQCDSPCNVCGLVESGGKGMVRYHIDGAPPDHVFNSLSELVAFYANVSGWGAENAFPSHCQQFYFFCRFDVRFSSVQHLNFWSCSTPYPCSIYSDMWLPLKEELVNCQHFSVFLFILVRFWDASKKRDRSWKCGHPHQYCFILDSVRLGFCQCQKKSIPC